MKLNRTRGQISAFEVGTDPLELRSIVGLHHPERTHLSAFAESTAKFLLVFAVVLCLAGEVGSQHVLGEMSGTEGSDRPVIQEKQ